MGLPHLGFLGLHGSMSLFQRMDGEFWQTGHRYSTLSKEKEKHSRFYWKNWFLDWAFSNFLKLETCIQYHFFGWKVHCWLFLLYLHSDPYAILLSGCIFILAAYISCFFLWLFWEKLSSNSVILTFDARLCHMWDLIYMARLIASRCNAGKYCSQNVMFSDFLLNCDGQTLDAA